MSDPTRPSPESPRTWWWLGAYVALLAGVGLFAVFTRVVDGGGAAVVGLILGSVLSFAMAAHSIARKEANAAFAWIVAVPAGLVLLIVIAGMLFASFYGTATHGG